MKVSRLFAMLIIINSSDLLFADESSDINKKKPREIETLVVESGKAISDNSAFVTNTIYQDQIFDLGVRNFSDTMKYIPGVLTQKTAHGQGSPYLRGFTGFRTLYLMNGIRLNNSIFRSGPNEYSSLIDTYALDTISVSSGPSSVRFGSDAIGGIFSVRSITADLDAPNNFRFFVRASDAEASIVSRLAYQGKVNEHVAYHLGLTEKRFGDMRTGGSSKRLQHTGYSEVDYDLSLVFQALGGTFTTYWQNATQDDVWRTHKTIYGQSFKGTDIGSDLVRKKDLTRKLGYLRYEQDNLENSSLYKNLSISISYQQLSEIRDRVKKDEIKDIQGIDVYTTGLDISLLSGMGRHTLEYGIQSYRDVVQSYKNSYQTLASEAEPSIQGPVGDDADYMTGSAYLQGNFSITRSFDIMSGARYTVVGARVEKFEDPETGDESNLNKHYEKLVGNLKLSYKPEFLNGYRFFTGAAQGFRAPNLSDLTRLDDARTNVLEVPSSQLDPEDFVSYELGLEVDKGPLRSKLALYHTAIKNMITLKPVSESNAQTVLTEKRNAGQGYVQGIELDVEYFFTQKLSARLFHNQMDSAVDSYPSTADEVKTGPLSRMLPATTKLMTSYNSPMAKITLAISRAEDQNKLSFDDKNDTQRIPPDIGTPGYITADLSLAHRFYWLSPDSWLRLTIENIGDVSYRVHGSGQNELGRNVIASLESKF
jgi:hemoglobin/transferrin/lactoferrin receptor protein